MASLVSFARNAVKAVQRDVVHPVVNAVESVPLVRSLTAPTATPQQRSQMLQQNIQRNLPTATPQQRQVIQQHPMATPVQQTSFLNQLANKQNNQDVLNIGKAGLNTVQQFVTRPIVQAATSLVPKQMSVQATNPVTRALIGNTPVQNLEKAAVHNYQTHPNLPLPARIGLSAAYTAGQVANDVPVADAALKGASKAVDAATLFNGLKAKQVIMDTSKLDTLNNARQKMTIGQPLDQKTLEGLHNIKNQNNLDFITGSPADRRQRIVQYLEQNGEAIPKLQARQASINNLKVGNQIGAVGKNVKGSIAPEAITAYHGSTNNKLTSLVPGAKTGLNEKRNLVYLTEDKKTAGDYAKTRGAGGQGVLKDSPTGKVYPVQVNGKVLDAYDRTGLDKLKSAPGYEQLSGKTKNHITNDTGLSPDILEANPELTNFLNQNGVTAVRTHLPNGGGATQLAVINHENLKLAQPTQVANTAADATAKPVSESPSAVKPATPKLQASSAQPKLTLLEQQLGHKIETKPYTGPNLNKGAFGKADEQALAAKESQQTDASGLTVEQKAALPPNEQMKLYDQERGIVTKQLSTAGHQVSELPPSVKGVGDLPAMQNLPTTNKLFSSKVNALDKINTPSSHELAGRVRAVEADKAAMRANWMSKIPTVQQLNKKETSNLFDVVQGQAKAINPKVAKAATEWQKLTPQVHEAGTKEGLLVGERKNYIPHHYNMKGISGNKSAYDNAIQYLIDHQNLDHNTAVQLFKNMQDEATKWPNRFGHFENARLTNMPGYEKTKSALYNYIEGAASRTAESKHLGTNNEAANRLLTNIRMEGGDVTTAQKALANYLRSPKGGIGSEALAKTRGVLGAAQLGKAVISHAGQTSNAAVDAGITRTAKGWGQFLAGSKGSRDFIDKTGVTNPQLLHQYQDQYSSVKGLLSKATAPGLNTMMKINRSVTALAYRNYANHLVQTGKLNELRDLGVTGKIDKTLTNNQEVQAARGGVDRTVFSPSRAATPIQAETTAGKVIGQYRTAYAYKQTGFIYSRVIKEARNGNLAPLARYLAVSAPVGAGTVALKNKISGNKEGPGGIGMDAAGALGGLPGEAALQLLRYGKRDLPSVVAGEVAPMAGTALTTLRNIQTAVGGKPAAAERQALGMIPIAGSRISKAVLPAKTGPTAPGAGASKATPNNKTTTLSAKGKTVKMTQRQLKGNNPNELIRWQGMTAKAKANVQLHNPQKYIRDTQAQAVANSKAGNSVQAFKDQQNVAKTQISANYNPTVVQAYGLNSSQFKAYVSQASPSTVAQLQRYDQQLVSKGLESSTKFTSTVAKATGYGSLIAKATKSTKTGSTKTKSTKVPKMHVTSIPRAKIASYKTPKIKIGAIKSGKFKAPKTYAYKTPSALKLNVKRARAVA